jgi:uncharacterized protein
MSGRSNYSSLIRSMKPVMNEGEYVYCTLSEDSTMDIRKTICTFHEKEGLTIILPRAVADDMKLNYSFVACWITLTVHSSLEAVGITAAVSKALAEANISCNAVAAYFHDHIFVAKKDAERAMRILTTSFHS